MSEKKVRQSNIELLRIVAILFVLIGHVGVVMGLPSEEDWALTPISSLIRILFSSFAVGGVDIFVLISGWFGIRSSSKGIGKFVYQVLFLLWSIYMVAIFCGKASFTVEGIKTSMGLTEGYWFVMAYLGLYILSPVLNAFCEYATKKQFRLLLLSFYCFQIYYSWVTGFVNYFEGYSIVMFCGLYLTARYVRIYPVEFIEQKSLQIYFLCSIFVFVIATMGLWRWGHALRMIRYDNPVVILAAVSLLQFFSKWQFHSKFINWMATGCFAVYIIHFNPFVFRYYREGVLWISGQYCHILFLIAMGLFLLLVFVACVLIDKVRIISWEKLFKP